MVRRQHPQRSIFEMILPDGDQRWDPELRRIDELLDDEVLTAQVEEALNRRRPQSRLRGRPGTPAAVALRLLVLKHLYDWSFADCVREVQAIIDTCKSLRADVLVLCHGGPIATPREAQFLLESCAGLDGFYGASSMERLPTETAITEEVRKFTTLKLRPERPPAAGKSGALAPSR